MGWVLRGGVQLPQFCREVRSHFGRQCFRTTTVRPPPPEAMGQIFGNPEAMEQLLGWRHLPAGPWPLRLARTVDEEALFERDIQIGADGSVILQSSVVYVLSVPIQDRLLAIDYFHGCYPDFGGAMPVFEEETYHYHRHHLARNMIATSRCGCAVRRLIKIQRLFRERRERARELGRNVRRRLQ